MNLKEGRLDVDKQLTKIFQGSSTTVEMGFLSNEFEVCKMKIFFHEEGNIYSGDCKEKAGFILFHDLYQRAISFHKFKDQL